VTECRFVRLSTYVPSKGGTCAAVRCMYANASVSSRAKVHRALKHDARIVDLSHRACETFPAFLSSCFLIRNFRALPLPLFAIALANALAKATRYSPNFCLISIGEWMLPSIPLFRKTDGELAGEPAFLLAKPDAAPAIPRLELAFSRLTLRFDFRTAPDPAKRISRFGGSATDGNAFPRRPRSTHVSSDKAPLPPPPPSLPPSFSIESF